MQLAGNLAVVNYDWNDQATREPIGARLPLVEDNPYGDLWFDSPPPAPLAARWPEGVIYLGSFSKVLTPGFRLGYLVAPPELYPKLLQAKQAADLHTPGFNQRVVHEVIRDGFLRETFVLPRSDARVKAREWFEQNARYPDAPPVPFTAPKGIRMVRIDRQSGRRVYGSWPGTDPKAAIIWEAFKPESEPRRTIREDEIKPIKTPKRSTGPAQKGSSGRTDTDFLDDRGGII